MEDDSDGVPLVGSEVFRGLGEALMAGLAYWGEQGCAQEAKGLSGIGISLAGAVFLQHRILQPVDIVLHGPVFSHEVCQILGAGLMWLLAGDEPAHGGHFLAGCLVGDLALNGEHLHAQSEATLHWLDGRALDTTLNDLAITVFRFA
jgi:hypothetical protein